MNSPLNVATLHNDISGFVAACSTPGSAATFWPLVQCGFQWRLFPRSVVTAITVGGKSTTTLPVRNKNNRNTDSSVWTRVTRKLMDAANMPSEHSSVKAQTERAQTQRLCSLAAAIIAPISETRHLCLRVKTKWQLYSHTLFMPLFCELLLSASIPYDHYDHSASQVSQYCFWNSQSWLQLLMLPLIICCSEAFRVIFWNSWVHGYILRHIKNRQQQQSIHSHYSPTDISSSSLSSNSWPYSKSTKILHLSHNPKCINPALGAHSSLW